MQLASTLGHSQCIFSAYFSSYMPHICSHILLNLSLFLFSLSSPSLFPFRRDVMCFYSNPDALDSNERCHRHALDNLIFDGQTSPVHTSVGMHSYIQPINFSQFSVKPASRKLQIKLTIVFNDYKISINQILLKDHNGLS